MYEVKAHSRCGRDIVGSERWQRQLQQQSHISFQCLGSFEDTTYIWMPHVGEKATMVRESGNEHDRFIVAVLEDGTLCTVSSESLVLSWSSRTTLCSFHWWFSARFPQYRKWSILWELVEVVCNTHFRLSLLTFLNFALLLDSFYKCFLIMDHISNVAS